MSRCVSRVVCKRLGSNRRLGDRPACAWSACVKCVMSNSISSLRLHLQHVGTSTRTPLTHTTAIGAAASSALAAPHALADAADTREDTSREAAPAESEDDSVINPMVTVTDSNDDYALTLLPNLTAKELDEKLDESIRV